MGLISTEVEINLHGNNIPYYENLGYEIPRVFDKYANKEFVKKGTSIKVKVEDLPHSSIALVNVKCDCCGKIMNKKYFDYSLHNHQGKYYCVDCANSILNSGKNNGNWNPNKTDEERIIKRQYPEYIAFIKRVLIRDNYTCICCGNHNNSMEVHHLNGYDWCIDGRVDDFNAVTLCEFCHKNFHLLYGKGGNTREQFEEWLGNTVLLLENYSGYLPTARQVYDVEEDKVYQSVLEYSRTHKVSKRQIYDCCNHKTRLHKRTNQNGEISYSKDRVLIVANHHLLWFDEYSQMTKEDLEKYIQQSTDAKMKQVICVTTGKTFSSIKDASIFYSTSQSKISNCCTGKRKTSGKLNGVPLKWMYLSDFKKLPQEEQEKILANVKEELS